MHVSELGDLDRSKGAAPIFQQIADKLRRAIVEGRLQPGEVLPSSAELRRHFGIATMTAREALVRLRNEGHVSSEQGRGFFVAGAADSVADMPAYAHAFRVELEAIVEASDAPLCHVSASGRRIVVGDGPTRTRAAADLEWKDDALTVDINGAAYVWRPGDDAAARQIFAAWGEACARPSE